MFSRLTSILTMAAMLAHSILGCCSHHVHACEHGLAVDQCGSVAEHLESHAPEGGEAEHEHDHGDCRSALTDASHAPRTETADSRVTVPQAADSSSDHDLPCHQSCDDRDCSFTQSPEVKPPSINDGRLCCPSSGATAFAEEAMANSICRTPEPGPPETLAAGCCRPMTQVWRL